jgi:mono/diheme cytochrome c family protein
MKTFVKITLLFITMSLCAGLLLRSSHAVVAARPGRVASEQEESESTASVQAARAAKLFDDKCARCHGADGRGHTIIGGMLGVPDFTNERWWAKEKSEGRLVNSITNGKGDMPAFSKKLSRREISILAAHVRGFRNVTH